MTNVKTNDERGVPMTRYKGRVPPPGSQLLQLNSTISVDN